MDSINSFVNSIPGWISLLTLIIAIPTTIISIIEKKSNIKLSEMNSEMLLSKQALEERIAEQEGTINRERHEIEKAREALSRITQIREINKREFQYLETVIMKLNSILEQIGITEHEWNSFIRSLISIKYDAINQVENQLLSEIPKTISDSTEILKQVTEKMDSFYELIIKDFNTVVLNLKKLPVDEEIQEAFKLIANSQEIVIKSYEIITHEVSCLSMATTLLCINPILNDIDRKDAIDSYDREFQLCFSNIQDKILQISHSKNGMMDGNARIGTTLLKKLSSIY